MCACACVCVCVCVCVHVCVHLCTHNGSLIPYLSISSNIWESEVPLGNQFTHKSQSVSLLSNQLYCYHSNSGGYLVSPPPPPQVHIVPYSPSLLSLLVTKKEFDLKFDVVFGGLSSPPTVYVVEVIIVAHMHMYSGTPTGVCTVRPLLVCVQ